MKKFYQPVFKMGMKTDFYLKNKLPLCFLNIMTAQF